jgi:hypothetical protein
MPDGKPNTKGDYLMNNNPIDVNAMDYANRIQIQKRDKERMVNKIENNSLGSLTRSSASLMNMLDPTSIEDPHDCIKDDINWLCSDAVEHTIEYVAHFDQCDREKDYETVRAFVEAKYGSKPNEQ